jgi:hypothetical protein
MSFLESRLFRLFQSPRNVKELSRQSEDLRHTLLSAIQDVVVLKTLLREKGIWDDALYQRMRVRQMINDHSTAGVDPWIRHSHYAYTLDEHDFLRLCFNAGDAEVQEFARKVDEVQTAT